MYTFCNENYSPQIYTGDTRLPITLCVMASSDMRLNLGVFGFFANAKLMCSQSSRTGRLLKCDCLHTQTAVHAGYLQEKPEDPQIEPHARTKMAQGLVSPSSISVQLLDLSSSLVFGR